jgi:glutathione S-transferase
MKAYIHPASPNCIAVLAAANEIGLELETESVDLFGGDNAHPRFLAINPNGLVPVLVHGDFVLWETAAILQYLAVCFRPGTLVPQDETARADVSRWQFWSAAHWQPALQSFIFQNLFKRLRGLGAADPGVLEEAAPRLAKNAAILNSALQDRRWICGEELTVADLTLGAYLVYAEAACVPLADYPVLLAWWSRLRQRTAWLAAEAGMPKLNS